MIAARTDKITAREKSRLAKLVEIERQFDGIPEREGKNISIKRYKFSAGEYIERTIAIYTPQNPDYKELNRLLLAAESE